MMSGQAVTLNTHSKTKDTNEISAKKNSLPKLQIITKAKPLL
jgi:hypothetical protein